MATRAVVEVEVRTAVSREAVGEAAFELARDLFRRTGARADAKVVSVEEVDASERLDVNEPEPERLRRPVEPVEPNVFTVGTKAAEAEKPKSRSRKR